MASDIGVKIGLEGEKQFKSALSEINQAFKVLGSEMKLVASQFDKNDTSMQAMTARNAVLTKEIEAQKQKIEVLRQALENASTSFGEADRRTQSWQIQLNNAEAALNDMERELKANNEALAEAGENSEEAAEGMDELADAADDVDKDLDDIADSADDTADGLDEAGDSAEDSKGKFEGLGKVLKTVGAALGAVVVAAAGAAVKLGQAVVENYADYEQLIGGVKTLFGTETGSVQEYAQSVGKTVDEVRDEYDSLIAAQTEVMRNADNAYKTAGLSANEYMETVTAFSASLIASLGGDTEAAAKVADMAITDMADNANKMGSDMESIQNAYKGFAKGQFNMLDNLKLGYGGTKSEMERLLADANALNAAQGIYTEYSIESYADIVDAIHVVQNEMGITGTTAREAAGTISGSIASMGSAWQNLLTGLGNPDADIELLCRNLMESLSNVVHNITPVLNNLVKALPEAFEALGQALMDMLPSLLSTCAGLFRSVLTMLIETLPELIPFVVDAVMTIIDALIDNLPLIVAAAIEIIVAICEGIGEALPELIPAIVEAVITIITTLMEHLPEIIEAGIQIIAGLVVGLIQAIPQIIAAIPTIISALVNGFSSNSGQYQGIGSNIVSGVWQGIQNAAAWFTSQVSSFFSGIVSGVKSFLGIASPSKVFAEIGGYMSQGLGVGFTDEMKGVEQDIEDAIPTDFDVAAKAKVSGAFDTAVGAVKTFIEHTGTIRVEGINSSGDLSGVVDIIVNNLRAEVRM